MVITTMRDAFFYQAQPMRVIFGPGTLAKLEEEASRLKLERLLVLSTPNHSDLATRAATLLGSRSAGIHPKALMHTPIESVEEARNAAEVANADGYVAIGGGSAIGLGKGIARASGLPIIAIPTTYSGSEMTPVWGLTAEGRKTTGRDARVLPTSVIYDPELTLNLPVTLSVTSGFNAIAHSVEGLYAPDVSPIIALMAEEGVRSLIEALPSIALDPHNIDARGEALTGAWLSGAVLGATTMSLHHKLCHILGGTFNLPHAETHTVLLPYVLAYNASAAPDAIAALQRATGTLDPAAFLQQLSRRLGAPTSLKELGLAAADLTTAVSMLSGGEYTNPREVSDRAVWQILSDALTGVDAAIGGSASGR
jgi:maleylacetate reductase